MVYDKSVPANRATVNRTLVVAPPCDPGQYACSDGTAGGGTAIVCSPVLCSVRCGAVLRSHHAQHAQHAWRSRHQTAGAEKRGPHIPAPCTACRSAVVGTAPPPPAITLLGTDGGSLGAPVLTQRLQVSYGHPPPQPLAPCQSGAALKGSNTLVSCRAVAQDAEGHDLSSEILVADSSDCLQQLLSGSANSGASSSSSGGSGASIAGLCWPCDLSLAQAGQCLPGRYNLSYSGAGEWTNSVSVAVRSCMHAAVLPAVGLVCTGSNMSM